MTPFRAFRIFLSLPLVLAAAAFAWHRPTQQDVTAEEYAVYRVVLADSVLSSPRGQVVVVDSAAIAPSPVHDPADAVRRSGVPGPVAEDFRARNRRPARLRERAFGAGRPVRLVSRAAVDSVFRGGGRNAWESFRTAFVVSGIVQLSRVGFSADGTVAVLTVHHTCGPLCGTGYVVWLERREGRWHVAGSTLQWVS